MKVELTREDYGKLDYLRGGMSRSEYLRSLIEARYNEERKEWLEAMKLRRQIQHIKHLLAIGEKLNQRKEEDHETHIV